MSKLKSDFFSVWDVLKFDGVFFVFLLIGHLILRNIRASVMFDFPQFWPLGVVMPNVPVLTDWVTWGAIAAIAWYLRSVWLDWKGWKWWMVGVFLLFLATNLLSGWQEGLQFPITGVGKHDANYWQDYENIHNVGNFLEEYVFLQPHMKQHAGTHPPGPVLYLYALLSVCNQWWFVGVVTVGMLLASARILYDVLRYEVSEISARWAGAMLLLLPAVQVYGWYTIDAVIMVLFLGTYWAWRKGDTWQWWLARIGFLWMGSFLTFAVWWLIGVLVMDTYLRKTSWMRLFILLGSVAVIYYGIYLLTDFNYWQSFRVGHELESNIRYGAIGTSWSYYATRLENILETLVFMGSLGFLIMKSVAYSKDNFKNLPALWQVSWLAWGGLIALFFAGSYATGETARAAMFVDPFILILIAYYVDRLGYSLKDYWWWLQIMLIQAVLMQMWGMWGW